MKARKPCDERAGNNKMVQILTIEGAHELRREEKEQHGRNMIGKWKFGSLGGRDKGRTRW
jgi:hypothetical protein